MRSNTRDCNGELLLLLFAGLSSASSQSFPYDSSGTAGGCIYDCIWLYMAVYDSIWTCSQLYMPVFVAEVTVVIDYLEKIIFWKCVSLAPTIVYYQGIRTMFGFEQTEATDVFG